MTQRTLILEIDSETDPVSGRLGEGTGPNVPFVGWLGLARALERVLHDPSPGDDDRSREH
jgi:hypothetical protein